MIKLDESQRGMKPSGMPRTPPHAHPTASAGAESPVSDELGAIDTSVLESMLEIGKRQLLVRNFLKRAEALKEGVAEAVYRKVVDDYTSRCAALDDQAAPVKVQARMEYQKLQDLFVQIGFAQDQARLAKQELEFRHAVGELKELQLAEQLHGPEDILRQCSAQLSSVEQLKARFLEVIVSDEGGDGQIQEEIDRHPSDGPPIAAEMPVSLLLDRTNPIPVEERAVSPERVSASPQQISPTLAQDDADPSSSGTILVPPAVLIVDGSDGRPQEYRLGVVNYIGRSEENQIRLDEPRASRRHAIVEVTPTGYSVKDLQSQNGTFVNRQPITEQPLSDGDRIGIGEVLLVFRAPWPARGLLAADHHSRTAVDSADGD